MRKLILLFVVVAMAVAGTAMAQAVVSEPEREAVRGVPDKWGFALGSFWQTFDSTIRLDGHTGTGSDISLEKDLGMQKSLTDVQLGFFYRFGDRHRLDVTYNAHATLNSKISANWANIIYKYSFFNNGKTVFGLNGGVSALWTKFNLTGAGEVNGNPVPATLAEAKSTILPIPVIGAHFELTLSKRLFWRAEGNFFAANIAGYDGNVNIVNTSLEYYFTRNVGLGAGFANVSYRVTKTGDKGGDLFVRYAFSGVFAHLAVVF